MELRNNRWYDDRGNSWGADIDNEASALSKSNSLIGCRYCSGCSDCRYCSGCSDCSDCSGCSDCSDCRYCSGCSDCSDNPERIVSPRIGSRKDCTTVYWLNGKTQVVCGCFRGDLDSFEAKVNNDYPDNAYGKEYMEFIEKVRAYMG